jgi:bacterial leucyl aminopeptidase
MMAEQVVFFDIGGTLGSPRISPPPFRLEGLNIYPFVTSILEELRSTGARLGIISNTGNETSESMQKVLEESGLFYFLDPALLIYSSVVGLEKDSPDIFQLAAQRSGHAGSPEQCLFVGEDSRERHYALQAGLKVCPHPLLAKEVLNGARLRFARLSTPPQQQERQWRNVLRQLAVVPLHSSGERGKTIHAIITQSVLPILVNSLFEVQLLGDVDDPLTADLYLLRDDLATSTGFLSDLGQSTKILENMNEAQLLLSSSEEGLLVKVPWDRSVEEFHFETANHGHNLKLMADPSLLEPFGSGIDERVASWLAVEATEPSLADAEKEELDKITAETIQQYLDRYTGEKPLGDDTETRIKSRHIQSADNARATEMLARDFQRIGGSDFSVSVHPFTHEGRMLYNVVAELPGESSDELVLVSAHLDSTAAFSRPYDPLQDPAPGADDDCSGVAAVLVSATALHNLATIRKPKRTLRFVLFNAEEHGLVGSRAYARDVALQAAPIVAVYQMDMIGYNVVAPRSFEVHAGYRDSQDVQMRSVALAKRIQRLAEIVSPTLAVPQLYESNRNQRDPAEERSDHYSFQVEGYAACLAIEDFFIGPATDLPTPEANPNYHQKADTFIDPAYAADIARCVTAAAWITANI